MSLHVDIVPQIVERSRRLERMRATRGLDVGTLAYYKTHIAQFITDWGVTFDPRLAEQGLPAAVPFVLFPKQIEFVDWMIERWMLGERGLCDKSRDMGVSWLVVAVFVSLAVTHEGLVLGLGSRDEDTVDHGDDPASLFWKVRFYAEHLPSEFRGGYRTGVTSAHMRVKFPRTRSVITGDAGDNIGRGGRASIFVVDEAAHLKNPQKVDRALSATTNCRIDVSSVSGTDNPFAERRWSGKIPVITMHWRDDPRKDDAWYAKQVAELDPVTVAQEIDINYSASVTGLLIPSEWVQAAIDLDKFLGVEVTGVRRAALDVADEGKDLNCWAGARGIRVEALDEWRGKGSDLFDTAAKALRLCDDYGTDRMTFDSDGLGAGIRGDCRVLNDQRQPNNRISVQPFRGGGKVANPDQPIPNAAVNRIATGSGRRNEDYFANAKAQAAWELRVRFQRAWRVREQGSLGAYNLDDLIVLDGAMPDLARTLVELSQPTYSTATGSGKVLVNKKPDNSKSPNRYDAIMMLFAPIAPDAGYDISDLRKALGAA